MAGSLLALVTYKSYHSASHPRGRPLSKNKTSVGEDAEKVEPRALWVGT